MYYTNGSAITKTFHGVTFKPGETKAVSGIINDPTFYRSSKRQEPPKRNRRKQHHVGESSSNTKTTKIEELANKEVKQKLNSESSSENIIKEELNLDSTTEITEESVETQ